MREVRVWLERLDFVVRFDGGSVVIDRHVQRRSYSRTRRESRGGRSSTRNLLRTAAMARDLLGQYHAEHYELTKGTRVSRVDTRRIYFGWEGRNHRRFPSHNCCN